MTGTAAAPAPTRPGPAALVTSQLGYALRELWRARVVFVFTFLFPLTWLVVIGFLAGNDTVDAATGVRVMQFVTPTAAAMGALYAAYPTVAASLAAAREQGVLKRLRGTPLPAWAYLTGRIGGAVAFAVGSVLTMLAVGVVVYDVQIVWRTVPAALVTVGVGIACFAALGLAVAAVAPSAGIAQAASIATAVVLGFLSGLFTVGELPGWASGTAAVLPLKPFTEALREQFNPFHAGAGWDLGALGVLAAWGVAGAVVATRAFRWDPPAGRSRPRPAPRDVAPRPVPTVTPARVSVVPGRPSSAALVLDQMRHAMRATWRDPGGIFFAVAMPVGLFAFTMAIGVDGAVGAGQVPFGVYLAAGMTAWGAAVTGFVNLPEALARARDRGVLKRLRGTPLRPGEYLAGRAVAALLVALGTGVLVVAVGVGAFGVRVAWAGLLPAAAVLVLGTATLAACGFALAAVLRSGKAVTAVGLAILLPVSFFSDVFPTGGAPAWMGTAGSVLPLRHLSRSLSAALDPARPAVSWASIAVLAGWLVAAATLAVRSFRWSGGN